MSKYLLFDHADGVFIGGLHIKTIRTLQYGVKVMHQETYQDPQAYPCTLFAVMAVAFIPSHQISYECRQFDCKDKTVLTN